MSTLLRLATAGSVDDGKSTLVGRLLYDSKSVLVDQLDAVERVSRDRGLGHVDLALLTDGLRAEREQGITIDVAYRYFATARRTFVLADCPGHVQYTRNTVTGASTADVVVLLVDARTGLVEQTRRHLAVAALLHVPHVIVAVNKIDLVDFSADVFASVTQQVLDAADDLGLVVGEDGTPRRSAVRTIPVSALEGDNVVTRSERTPWYAGPSLLEMLEDLPLGADAALQPLRFPVQLAIRPQSAARDAAHHDYRGYAGQVAQGVVRVGDEVVVLPAGTRTSVIGIDTLDGPLEAAVAPRSVVLRLADDLDVARGDLLAAALDAPEAVQDVIASLCWLADTPLITGARVLVKSGTRTVQAVVREVLGRLDLDTGDVLEAERLELNDVGTVALRLAAPVPVEHYATSRATGAFLVIDAQDGRTLAAGMVGAPHIGPRCRSARPAAQAH